jgi:hypothetical protein
MSLWCFGVGSFDQRGFLNIPHVWYSKQNRFTSLFLSDLNVYMLSSKIYHHHHHHHHCCCCCYYYHYTFQLQTQMKVCKCLFPLYTVILLSCLRSVTPLSYPRLIVTSYICYSHLLTELCVHCSILYNRCVLTVLSFSYRLIPHLCETVFCIKMCLT